MIEQTNYDYITVINMQDNSLDLEFDSDDFQSLAEWLFLETKSINLQEEWQSKYNPYIISCMRPPHPRGFKYIAKLFYKNIEQVKFADCVLDKEIQKRKELDNLLLI